MKYSLAKNAVIMSAAATLAVVAAPLTSARADDMPPLEFSLTPYVWVAGVTGTLSTPLPSSPSQSIKADFGDVLTKLNKVPVMLNGELRAGPIGVMGDIIGISVKSSLKNTGPLYTNPNVTVGQLVGSVMGTYRAVDTAEHKLDIGLGVRAFRLSTKFELGAGALPGRSFDQTLSWANPIVGLRYHYNFGPEWGLSAYGDIGGGDHSSLTWQALGTVDYQLNSWSTLRGGYRYMGFRYNTALIHQNMGIGGPILGGTMRF